MGRGIESSQNISLQSFRKMLKMFVFSKTAIFCTFIPTSDALIATVSENATSRRVLSKNQRSSSASVLRRIGLGLD
jgi:hypothetical protein